MNDRDMAIAAEMLVRRDVLKKNLKNLETELKAVEGRLSELVTVEGRFVVTMSDNRKFAVSVSECTRLDVDKARIENEEPSLWDRIRSSFMKTIRYNRLNVKAVTAD